MLNANTDLRFQAYFLQRFTDGNMPEAFASAPEIVVPGPDRAVPGPWDSMHVRGPVAEAPDPVDARRLHDRMVQREGLHRRFLPAHDAEDRSRLSRGARPTWASPRTRTTPRGESQADVRHRVGDLPFDRIHRADHHRFPARRPRPAAAASSSTAARSKTTGSARPRPTTCTSRPVSSAPRDPRRCGSG